MQLDDVKYLREEWGNKPCDHPSIEKEYFNATSTGDYVCTQCGQTRSSKEGFKNDNYKPKENTHSVIDGETAEYNVNKKEVDKNED